MSTADDPAREEELVDLEGGLMEGYWQGGVQGARQSLQQRLGLKHNAFAVADVVLEFVEPGRQL